VVAGFISAGDTERRAPGKSRKLFDADAWIEEPHTAKTQPSLCIFGSCLEILSSAISQSKF